ncbi:creatininase family protein [Bythopirellula polymerisocia]|uniref:Creatinine amidohydrolase n=1 Tax=Bythopirellula polymerisocia TaxID=2528003 RepID=A0A5C6CXF8_9BACT|nr:creatininase family protein [Bythopirellula polymerisocia]TWU28304.1 Creatinine amidohydrolase [Bythopirellula polymerisocia]
MQNKKHWRLSELSLPDVSSQIPKVVVLPFGATEPHGRHLPYGTDIIEVEAIAERSCQLANECGVDVAYLPVIPFGVQTSQQSYPLAMNLYPSTLNQIISDLTESMDNSGIEKAVLLNGHGGNDFYMHLKELFGKRRVYLTQVNWFSLCQELAGEIFAPGGDHANDMETSLVLHLCPELVDMAGAGSQPTAKFRLAAMRAGWARAPRPWDRYTEDSGAGDPRSATAEKGEQFFNAICKELADFLVELAGANIDDKFPFC